MEAFISITSAEKCSLYVNNFYKLKYYPQTVHLYSKKIVSVNPPFIFKDIILY